MPSAFGSRSWRGLAAAISLMANATLQAAFAPVHAQTPTPVAAATCAPEGGFSFLCGIKSPEDLMTIPGTHWVVTGSFTTDGSGGLYAIDADHPALTRIYPAATAKAEPDLKAYPACKTPPEAANFSALGLSIRPRADGGGWLYVVGGGARHGIEAFKIDAPKDGPPVVTWIGCVPAPQGATLNAVAGMMPGEMVTTAIFEAPFTFADAQAGKLTGNIYQRLAGEPLAKVPNTNLAGDNGVEVNREHKYVFVAVTGTRQILRYERLNPTKPPVVLQLESGVDNLRGGPDGKLVFVNRRRAADCAADQTCPQTIMIMGLDREAMTASPIASFPATARWSGGSTALIVGNTVFLGSPGGDRIAYRPLP